MRVGEGIDPTPKGEAFVSRAQLAGSERLELLNRSLVKSQTGAHGTDVLQKPIGTP